MKAINTLIALATIIFGIVLAAVDYDTISFTALWALVTCFLSAFSWTYKTGKEGEIEDNFWIPTNITE